MERLNTAIKKNERLLAKKGYAKTFKVFWSFKQSFEGNLILEDGVIKNSQFSWK